MKVPVLLTALALACGSGFANTATKDADHPKSEAKTVQSGDSLGAKTKRGLHKMGDKMRAAGHKLARATHTDKASRDDTRAMGAPSEDSARRARMDDAYANYQKKQQK